MLVVTSCRSENLHL